MSIDMFLPQTELDILIGIICSIILLAILLGDIFGIGE